MDLQGEIHAKFRPFDFRRQPDPNVETLFSKSVICHSHSMKRHCNQFDCNSYGDEEKPRQWFQFSEENLPFFWYFNYKAERPKEYFEETTRTYLNYGADIESLTPEQFAYQLDISNFNDIVLEYHFEQALWSGLRLWYTLEEAKSVNRQQRKGNKM